MPLYLVLESWLTSPGIFYARSSWKGTLYDKNYLYITADKKNILMRFPAGSQAYPYGADLAYSFSGADLLANDYLIISPTNT